ncbi:hypothetical protein [Baekduia sp. Peel2402]|uniref:hypothetical protein n=1 Tax=Baekduia sp. Peel2402 TaxID=3458296 RepID=UPI00403EB9BF
MTALLPVKKTLGTPVGRWGPAAGDVPLAVLVAVLGFFMVTGDDGDKAGGSTAAGLGMTLVALALLARRPAPLLGLAGLALADLINIAAFGEHVRCGVVLPSAAYLGFAAARRANDRLQLAAIAGLMAAIGTLTVVFELGAEGILACVLVLGGAVVGGRVVRRRDIAVARLADGTRALEAQREQTARLAVENERVRIGGQVGRTVDERLEGVLAGAREGDFAAIEADGRAGLAEMRRVVDGLQGTAPAPTLAQLDDLVAERGASTLAVEGERRPLAPGVEVAACRIVELLLGVVDPGDAGVRVRVRYGADELAVELDGRADVESDPALVAAARERVAAVGGSIDLRRGVARVLLPAAAAGGA